MNPSLPGLEPVEGMARIYCHCGCGVWFYVPRKKGRRRLYVNAQHYRREKYRRECRRIPTASVPGGPRSPATGEGGTEGRPAPVPPSSPLLDREQA